MTDSDGGLVIVRRSARFEPKFRPRSALRQGAFKNPIAIAKMVILGLIYKFGWLAMASQTRYI